MLRLLQLVAASLLLALSGCKATPKPGSTVTYSEIDGQKLEMDLYLPSAPATALRPAVLLVHGGGWEAGSRQDLAWLGQWLANNNRVAFSASYRLLREDGNKWPAQLHDVQRAIRWIRANAATYQVDPDRVGALGISAGGHLVACLGTMDTLDNTDPALAAFSSRATCVIDLCGPTDLTEDFRPKVARGEWCNQLVDKLLGNKTRAGAREASPLFAVDSKSSPFLIVHGRKDDIVPFDQSERLHAALQAASVESEFLPMDCGHSFDSEKQMLEFIAKAEDFLKKHLR